MKMCMNFKFVVLFALTLLAGSTVYGQDNVIDEVVWVGRRGYIKVRSGRSSHERFVRRT